MKHAFPFLLIPLLAACQNPGSLGQGNEMPPDLMAEGAEGEAYSSTGEPWLLRPQARDQAEDAETATATGPIATGLLGRSIASLGPATEGGMWMSTPLVSAPQPGRVRASDTGRDVALTLRPAAGAGDSGARLSLQAMQALGLPLTALAEVEIYGG